VAPIVDDGNAVRPGRRRWAHRRAALLHLAPLWPLNLVLLIFFLFPFYWLTVNSLKPPGEVYTYPIRWLDQSLKEPMSML
jgi:ABC-type glycerol-3-phosphate transport system permease component